MILSVWSNFKRDGNYTLIEKLEITRQVVFIDSKELTTHWSTAIDANKAEFSELRSSDLTELYCQGTLYL
jgi:hypothetical protein